MRKTSAELPADVSRAIVFDDQYITTGGQRYELMAGHDRFIADLRPILYRIQGLPVWMSVHPYDLSALLIAQEAGIELTDGLGGPLDGQYPRRHIPWPRRKGLPGSR